MVDQSNLEPSILRVEESYRIRLPQPLVRRVGWIAGNQAIGGWLLVDGPGRCRLFSASEADSDPNLQLLSARVSAEVNATRDNALEFHNEVSLALAFRLLPVQITPPEPGWRLTLPRLIAAIMQVRPGESEVAALFFQGHIELWTIETLRTAVVPRLTEIL